MTSSLDNPFVGGSSAVQRAVAAAQEAAAAREGKGQEEDPSVVEAREELRKLMSACGPSSEDAGANALEINPEVQAIGSRPRAGDAELNASAMEPSGGGLMTGPLPPPPGSPPWASLSKPARSCSPPRQAPSSRSTSSCGDHWMPTRAVIGRPPFSRFKDLLCRRSPG